jgi:CBS domain-containing protein
VLDKGEITGVFSFEKLLESPLTEKIIKFTAKDIMSRTMTVASPDDKIGLVYNKFKKSDIFSIPVVEKGRYLGVINLHDTVHTIIQHKEKPDFGTKLGEKAHLLDLPVSNIMTPPTIYASVSSTVGEIIDKIVENKLDSISIIDENNNLKAIITLKDLLKMLTGEETLYIMPKIQINSDVENLNRTSIQKIITEFTKKFSSILSNSEVKIYMRAHREKQKRQRLIYTRIKIHAHHDKFDATAEAWGENHSVKEALEKIEKQVRRSKRSKKHLVR